MGRKQHHRRPWHRRTSRKLYPEQCWEGGPSPTAGPPFPRLHRDPARPHSLLTCSPALSPRLCLPRGTSAGARDPSPPLLSPRKSGSRTGSQAHSPNSLLTTKRQPSARRMKTHTSRPRSTVCAQITLFRPLPQCPPGQGPSLALFEHPSFPVQAPLTQFPATRPISHIGGLTSPICVLGPFDLPASGGRVCFGTRSWPLHALGLLREDAWSWEHHLAVSWAPATFPRTPVLLPG